MPTLPQGPGLAVLHVQCIDFTLLSLTVTVIAKEYTIAYLRWSYLPPYFTRMLDSPVTVGASVDCVLD